MSVPVHFNGSLLNIMGGGASAAPSVGATLGISNFALYNFASGTSLGARLTNGLEVASLSFTPGSFTGGPYTGVGTPPLVGTISAGAVPSSTSITATNQFSFLADVSNIIKADFNANYTAAGFPTVTSVITAEIKFHDDTNSSTLVDWFPDGVTGPIGGGGTAVLDPFSLNTTVATSTPQSGHFQLSTPTLAAGHTYTLTVTMSVTNS